MDERCEAQEAKRAQIVRDMVQIQDFNLEQSDMKAFVEDGQSFVHKKIQQS